MEIKLFKKENITNRKISNSYLVSNFLTANDSDKISIAVGNAINHNEITKINSERVYFVLEGEIIIDDNLIGKSGDVIFIPSNKKYSFKGTFKVVIVNSPPFRKENENIIKS